jgi:transcription initiation factor TFIIIB Brf1 subunit/transcription initiation factor TFIIB
LKLPTEVGEGAIQFFEDNKSILKRFKPSASASVCIYSQTEKCEQRTKQKETAECLKVSEVTMRNIMRILKEHKRL